MNEGVVTATSRHPQCNGGGASNRLSAWRIYYVISQRVGRLPDPQGEEDLPERQPWTLLCERLRAAEARTQALLAARDKNTGSKEATGTSAGQNTKAKASATSKAPAS